ncbi:glycoside hydrolase family 3 protein [bacterium]|nr:glycoside hydrolase family 3 protein [bacterium]
MRKLIKSLIAAVVVALSMTGAWADEVDDLVAQMTLAEKIGQMTQAERSAATPNDVATFFLGSILSGGGSSPADGSVAGWAAMHDAYQQAALSTRLGIPILYGIDAVHGHNNVVGATIFPHNIGLGATRDRELIEEIGRITALEVSATGLEWTFAPAVSVARDQRWGRTYESFGEDPALQNLLTARYLSGLQGSTMGGEHLIACAKHYVGDGGTANGTDQGNTILDETALRQIHMQGFIQAVSQNVGTVMPSYSSWNGDKMHGNGYLITTVLKGELGFDGFVISDWNAIDQLPGSYYDQVVASVNAGIDMFMEPYRYGQFIATLTEAVNNGDVSMNRIDDAVIRILRVKFASGVMDSPYADQDLVTGGLVGSAAHRAVAREAVRKSAVLLKNDGVLPLDKNANIYLAGKGADSIGYQMGGWSIGWQGTTDPNATPGATIREALEHAVAATSGTLTYNRDGYGVSGDVAVVVVAEEPYAEFYGDNLNGLSIDPTELDVLNRVLNAGLPTVVVMLSGRPLFVSDEIDKWDAFVAAWLPGTEGDGLADVLFGDYDFTGKLPMTWPRDASQVPLNVGDEPYDPLFPYGYGLRLRSGGTSFVVY